MLSRTARRIPHEVRPTSLRAPSRGGPRCGDLRCSNQAGYGPAHIARLTWQPGLVGVDRPCLAGVCAGSSPSVSPGATTGVSTQHPPIRPHQLGGMGGRASQSRSANTRCAWQFTLPSQLSSHRHLRRSPRTRSLRAGRLSWRLWRRWRCDGAPRRALRRARRRPRPAGSRTR